MAAIFDTDGTVKEQLVRQFIQPAATSVEASQRIAAALFPAVVKDLAVSSSPASAAVSDLAIFLPPIRSARNKVRVDVTSAL
jgi:hypothetical protein